MSTVNLADALRWPALALLRKSPALHSAPWVDSAALDLGYEVAFPFLADARDSHQQAKANKEE